jgi:hypothetical protein
MAKETIGSEGLTPAKMALLQAPTHVLLQYMRDSDTLDCENAFKIVYLRYYGPFERDACAKLGVEHGSLVASTSLWKIFRAKSAYKEKLCACQCPCLCAERRAHKYVWKIHDNTVKDWRRDHVTDPWEVLDETWPLPENSEASPEAYVESRSRQAAIYLAWNRLSASDREVLRYVPGRGRSSPALREKRKNIRREALERFRLVLKIALAEEE